MSQKPATHCWDCDVELTEVNKVYLAGRQKNRCKPCYNIRQREWAKNNPNSRSKTVKQHKILSVYGLTIEQYNEMLKIQGGVCAICHQYNNIEGRGLTVDHDHNNGKIRSLLCSACNAALGLVKENVTTLYSMIEYINRHEPKINVPNLVVFGKREEEAS